VRNLLLVEVVEVLEVRVEVETPTPTQPPPGGVLLYIASNPHLKYFLNHFFFLTTELFLLYT